MQLDPETVERLCALHNPDLLYVIHYVGWPQPMPALVELCRRRGMLLVEDCALSLLSETAEAAARHRSATGRSSVSTRRCRCRTARCSCRTGRRLEALERLPLRHAGSASVLGRTAELLVQRIRGRANGVGAALQVVKRGMGRAAGALDVRRANVGDIGFNLDEVDLAMSGVSARLLERLDFEDIRRRRVANYRLLDAALDPDGACGCSASCPMACARSSSRSSCRDKHAAAARAAAARRRCPRVLEREHANRATRWDRMRGSCARTSSSCRFTRTSTPRHIAHVAREVSALSHRLVA